MEHALNVTTRRVARQFAAGAIAASALITLSGCGSSGGSIGYNAFTRAADADMPALCEAFLGDSESVGGRFGLTLYESDMYGGACLYETNTGGQLALTVADENVDDATLYARGEKYFTAVTIVDSDGEHSGIATDKRESVTKWLEGRANAVTDDRDQWLADLPTVAPGYARSSGFYIDTTDSPEPRSLSGTLYTPAAEVYVSSLTTPHYLNIDETETAAGEDEKFLVSGVTITKYDTAEVVPEFFLTYDGEAAGADADKALNDVVVGSTTQIALSAPKDVKDVALVVKTGDSSQSISLLDGAVKDNGESARLQDAVAGVSSATFSAPEILDERGSDVYRWSSWYPDYSKDASWSVTPWSATDGWAPEGQAHFLLTLEPVSPEAVLPLTAADAKVSINGTDYPASMFDPKTYTFHFLIPEGVARINVRAEMKVDTSQLDSDPRSWNQEWGEGYSLGKNETFQWAIDPNNVPDDGSVGD